MVVPPAVAQVAVAPWYTLSENGPAQLARFRGAYLTTTGECDSCGTEACGTWLAVELAPLDGSAYVAAARRPPVSWERSVPAAACVDAEAFNAAQTRPTRAAQTRPTPGT
jgi:hypothetical protein